jgi:hypothetical protein
MDNNMLTQTKCSRCGGHFVTEPNEIARNFVCGLCEPPARAGKGSGVRVPKLQCVLSVENPDLLAVYQTKRSAARQVASLIM